MRSWSNCKFHLLACRVASNTHLSNKDVKALAYRAFRQDNKGIPYIADYAVYSEFQAASSRRAELQQQVANEASVREQRSNFEIQQQQEISRMQAEHDQQCGDLQAEMRGIDAARIRIREEVTLLDAEYIRMQEEATHMKDEHAAKYHEITSPRYIPQNAASTPEPMASSSQTPHGGVTHDLHRHGYQGHVQCGVQNPTTFQNKPAGSSIPGPADKYHYTSLVADLPQGTAARTNNQQQGSQKQDGKQPGGQESSFNEDIAPQKAESKTSTHDALKTEEASSSRTISVQDALVQVNPHLRAIGKHLPENFEGHLEHRRRLQQVFREAGEDFRLAPEFLKPLKATKESWVELDRKASQKMQATDNANMDLHRKLNSGLEDQIDKIVGKRMDAVLKGNHHLKAQVARLATQVDTLSKDAVKQEQLIQQMQLVDDNQRQHDRWLNGVTDLANALRGHVDQHKKVLDEAQPGLMARHAPS